MNCLSKYNYIKTLKDKRTLIWNTYTGSLFVLDKNEYEELLVFEGESFKRNFQYYFDGGIILDENNSGVQLEFIRKLRQKIYASQQEINFRILPTTGCNANCSYCYEKKIKTITMTDLDADAIIAFINETAKPYNKINIFWFGGEPLLYPDNISYITEKLIAENPQKELYFDMTTNGILFDESMIKIAANDWHISEVQISLDGTNENYNRIKNYKNINEPYQTIIKNISNLIANKINVVIRLNVDKENYLDLIKLVYQIYALFNNKIQVYAYPIFSTDFHKANVINDTELVNYMSEIYYALKQCGYIDRIITFKKPISCACSSILPNNFVIMPNGDLLKCSSEIGQDLVLGNVRTGIINKKRNGEWSTYKLDNKCEECCFLPICQGGCLAPKFCNTFTRRCCLEKYLLDGLIDKFYEQEIEY